MADNVVKAEYLKAVDEDTNTEVLIQFIPPEPDETDRGGITKQELEQIEQNKKDVSKLKEDLDKLNDTKIGRKKVISYNKNNGIWNEGFFISVNSKKEIVPITNTEYAYYVLDIPSDVKLIYFWFKKIEKVYPVRWYTFVDENGLSIEGVATDAQQRVSSYTNEYCKLNVPNGAKKLYVTYSISSYSDLIITFDSVQDFSKSIVYEEIEELDDDIKGIVSENAENIDNISIIEKYKERKNINDVYFKDYLRPKYHITPEIGCLCDPCGFVYYKGLYHLYFQYNPYTVYRNAMTWGHLVSKDMIQWDYAYVAIPRTETYDIWSGNCIVDENDVSGLGKNTLLAYLTEYNGTLQNNAIYYSYDGYTFKRYGTFLNANDSPTASSSADFRDPKVVWHPLEQYYIMSVCCYKSVAFYKSTDLINWTYVNKYDYKSQMECPNVVYYEEFDCMAIYMAIEGSTWAIFGKWSSNGFRIITEATRIDGGYPYAMDTLTNSPDGNVYGVAFCMPNKNSNTDNLMTTIRKLDITNVSTAEKNSNMKCIQTPYRNILNCFSKVDSFEYIIKSDVSYKLPIGLSSGYVHLVFDYSGIEEPTRGRYPDIKLFCSSTEYLLIQYNKPANYIAVNRTYCGDKSMYSGLVQTSKTFELKDDKVILDILFDEKIAEIFVNDGEVAITVPVMPRANGIVIDGKKTMTISGEIYKSPYLLDNENKLFTNIDFDVPKDNKRIKYTSNGIVLQTFNSDELDAVLSKERHSLSMFKSDFAFASYFNDRTMTSRIIVGFADINNYTCVEYDTNSIDIKQKVDGVSTTLASIKTTINNLSTYEAMINYADGVLKAYLNGTEMLSANVNISDGYIGISGNKYGSISFNNIYMLH